MNRLDNLQQLESGSLTSKSNRSDRAVFVVILLLATGFAGAAAKTSWKNYQRVTEEERRQLLPVTVAEVIGYRRNPSDFRGEVTSPYTLVEFGDYQCPPCRGAHREMNQILKKYKGKIRLTFRNFPLISLHSHAMVAAEAAEAARIQGCFWEMHDELFEHDLNDESLRLLMRPLHIKNFLSNISLSKRAKSAVNDDIRIVDKLAFKSTPTFILCCPDGQVIHLTSLGQLSKYVQA